MSRIVLKFGSGILTKDGGTALNPAQFTQLVDAVSRLVQEGHECIVVTSGAAAAGFTAFQLHERPSDLATLQMCAAVGQSRLMHFYETRFREHDLKVAQLLISNAAFEDPGQRTNLTNTLEKTLEFDGVIPIINENDSVAVEELKVGDNDRLSARVAILAKADLLIVLTSVAGLLDSEGQLIESVPDIDAVVHHVNGDIGVHSTGGMGSKLEAVKEAVSAGIETIIASGFEAGQLADLAAGKGMGTRFSA